MPAAQPAPQMPPAAQTPSAAQYLQGLFQKGGEPGLKEFVGNNIYPQVLQETGDER